MRKFIDCLNKKNFPFYVFICFFSFSMLIKFFIAYKKTTLTLWSGLVFMKNLSKLFLFLDLKAGA